MNFKDAVARLSEVLSTEPTMYVPYADMLYPLGEYGHAKFRLSENTCLVVDKWHDNSVFSYVLTDTLAPNEETFLSSHLPIGCVVDMALCWKTTRQRAAKDPKPSDGKEG